jgi:hypothetical protein
LESAVDIVEGPEEAAAEHGEAGGGVEAEEPDGGEALVADIGADIALVEV